MFTIQPWNQGLELTILTTFYRSNSLCLPSVGIKVMYYNGWLKIHFYLKFIRQQYLVKILYIPQVLKLCVITLSFVMTTNEEFVDGYWCTAHALVALPYTAGRNAFTLQMVSLAYSNSTYKVLSSQFDIITCLTFIFLLFRS